MNLMLERKKILISRSYHIEKLWVNITEKGRPLFCLISFSHSRVAYINITLLKDQINFVVDL